MNTRNVYAALLLLTCSLVAACSNTDESTPTAPLPIDQQAMAAVADARATYDRSVELGFAWHAAQVQLTEAEHALAQAQTEADHQTALAYAVEAKLIAQASLKQAETESEAWRTRAPFN